MSEKGNSLNVLEIIKADDFQKLEDIPDMVVFPADNELRFFPENCYSCESPVFELDGNNRWVKFIESPLIELIEPSLPGVEDFNKFVFSGGIVSFLLDPESHASYRDAMMFSKYIYCLDLLNKKGQFAVDGFYRECLRKMLSTQLLESLELPIMTGYSSNEGRRLKYRKGGRCISFTAFWNVSAKPIVEELADIAIKGAHKKFIKTELDRQALAACYSEFLIKAIKSCEKNCPDKNYKSIISKSQQFWRDIIRKDINAKIPVLQYRKPPITIDWIHDNYSGNSIISSVVPMPSCFMRNSNTASTSLENNHDIMVIDKDEDGWPVAVARKFGAGTVVFLPSCIDMEDLKSKISSIKVAIPGARGWDLLEGLVKTPVTGTVQLAGEIQENDIKNTLEILSVEVQGNAQDVLSAKVKINNKSTVNVPASKLIKFLVIWIHSTKGKGIMFCSDKMWEGLADNSEYSQLMALDVSGCKDAVIGEGIIFSDKKKSEVYVQYFKRKIISAVILGKQLRKVKTKQDKEKQRDNTKLLAEVFKKQGSHEEDIQYQVWRLQIRIGSPSETVISAIEEFLAQDKTPGKLKDVFMTAFKEAIASQK